MTTIVSAGNGQAYFKSRFGMVVHHEVRLATPRESMPYIVTRFINTVQAEAAPKLRT